MSDHKPRLNVVHAVGAMQVEQCDIPEDMTLGEWRRMKAALECGPRRRGLIARVLKRAA
jgi:hypothetical protein